MNGNTLKAKSILTEGGYTCVLCLEEAVYTSCDRGVKPLLAFHSIDADYSGFCAADKVVGAGAAYLYVLLGVTELWADIISEKAICVLERYGIAYSAGTIVPQIVNRTGDGFCPIENAVADAASPADALERIKTALKNLRAEG